MSSLSRRTLLATGAAGVAASLSAPAMGAAGAGRKIMDPIVTTKAGDVRGRLEDGIAIFRGIPFAEAPVGALRFRPPARRRRWDGVRDATVFGPVSPQNRFPIWQTELFAPVTPPGDDCLNLNVWTPAPGADAKLPVFVWIHGGGFMNGSGGDTIYDGRTFARDGVVCVTINYRLDVLGFLYAGDAGAGNFAILDQVEALTWVRENIAAFGGDPDRVTIGGESAGGWSVGTLLGVPAARGLYRRAISMSGAAHHSTSVQRAQFRADAICGQLGLARTDLAALQAVPPERMLQAGMAALGNSPLAADPEHFGDVLTSWLPFMPVAGTDVLPRRAVDSVAAGEVAGVDLLVGTVLNEGRLFLLQTPTPAFAQAFGNDAMVAGAFASVFGDGAPAALAVYKANRPGASPFDLASALMSDLHFRLPAMRLADAQARHNSNTWSYRFSWPSNAFDGALGASHAVDVPFVWNSLGDRISKQIIGEGAPQRLADQMHAAWIAFIKTGDPNHAKLPNWPRHDPARRPVMDFGAETRLLADPGADEAALWAGATFL
jgi:para-nitrobenzyl esterase